MHTKISLSNAREAGREPLEVEALVDTGAATLCVPDHVAGQLRGHCRNLIVGRRHGGVDPKHVPEHVIGLGLDFVFRVPAGGPVVK